MSETIWYTGSQKHVLTDSTFTTILEDQEFDQNKPILDAFYDHLNKRQSKTVEVLYSGGKDSELVLYSCIKLKIPVVAMTMDVRVNGQSINTHDLYYAQKFCRQHNIEQKTFIFHADKFYDSNQHLDYLCPYNIPQPHVASHFWLLEQCDSFPVIGGDWPWVQMHLENKVLSPTRLSFSCYESFMKTKGIYGIGNMLGYSHETIHAFIKLQMKHWIQDDDMSSVKNKMFLDVFPEMEQRYSTYGWTQFLKKFDFIKYRTILNSKIKSPELKIKWGSQIQNLLQTPETMNSKF